MVVTAARDPAGRPIVVISAQNEKAEVPADFANPSDDKYFEKMVASPKFIAWATSYAPRPQQRLSLKKITIKNVEFNAEGQLDFLRIAIDVTRYPEETKYHTSLTVQGSSIGLLVVLRVNPGPAERDAGTSADPRATVASKKTDEERNTDRLNAPPRGMKPREYVLFVKRARPSIGAPEHREIFMGDFVEGKFSGEDADLLEKVAGISVFEWQLVDMSTCALAARRKGFKSLGISLAPGSQDGRVRLCLYRANATQASVDALLSRQSQNLKVDVVLRPLSDAWCSSSDAKTLAGLLIFHELRYHFLMPKNRVNREPRRMPQFISVADIDPNEAAISLRVLVADAPRLITASAGSERGSQSLGEVTVGDGTGIIKLRFPPDQMERFSSVKSPLFLRNVEVEMTDAHMTLMVTKFTRAAEPKAEELSQFDFQVNMANDMSLLEFEEKQPSNENPKPDPSLRPTSYSNGRRPNRYPNARDTRRGRRYPGRAVQK